MNNSFSDPLKNQVFREVTTDHCDPNEGIKLECSNTGSSIASMVNPSFNQVTSGCVITVSFSQGHLELNGDDCKQNHTILHIINPYFNETGIWECRIGYFEQSKYIWVDTGNKHKKHKICMNVYLLHCRVVV